MDADSDSNDFIEIKRQFKHKSDQEKLKILEEKDKASTQKATAGALRQLKEYLLVNKLPKVDDLTVDHLADILYDFYPAIKPQKGDDYSVQSLKCIRSALARHFRAVRGIDITKDSPFVKCNEMFRAVTVHSKKQGKGVRTPHPPITSIDMERISEYFNHDHITLPDPRHLQKHMLFYIIYYFCRRGWENLYEMQQDTFKIVIEPDGTEYVVQAIDEADKNHGPQDSDPTNKGRMYGNEGDSY